MSVLNELFGLAGQSVLVTGSSRGIGRAIAERMAQAGARVVISSRKQDACDEVAQQIRAGGGQAIAHACNISSKSELEQLVARTRAEFGRIDVLICNAAVNPHFGPSQEIPDSAFQKVLDNNIRSNHWLCQMVIPEMAERRSGSVIIVSSVGGLKGSTTLGTYGMSKAADMALARNLAVEWGPRNVRVNCIAPGLVRTDFAKALWDNPEIYEQTIQRYPLRRIGEPDEIAGTAIFLASAAGSFITGQTIVVDGGSTVT